MSLAPAVDRSNSIDGANNIVWVVPNESTERIIWLSTIQGHRLIHVEMPFSVHGISFRKFMFMHPLSGSPFKMMRRAELADGTRLLLP